MHTVNISCKLPSVWKHSRLYCYTQSPQDANETSICTYIHPFNGHFSGTTRISRYQKGKPIWILLMQETVSGSGISWATCKSAPSSRQITTPAPHHSVFLQAGCPICRPTNSVKALKAHNFINKYL